MSRLGKGCFVLFVGLMVASVPFARADMLELRVGAGITASDFGALDSEIGDINSGVTSDNLESYNIDLIWNIPVSPINVGLRYEVASQDQSGGSVSNVDFASWDLDSSKIMALADFRFLDTVFYAGPIVGFGFTTADYKSNINGTVNSTSIDGYSYLLGLEGGVHLGRFIVGAEAGYDGSTLDSPSGLDSDIDLSGVYGKLMVGISFL